MNKYIPAMLIALITVMIAGGASYHFDLIDNPLDNTTDGLDSSDIEGNITTVSISDTGATPSDPTIVSEDGIKFTNEAGVDLVIEFDREIDSFQISAGESKIIDPTSIVYYTANPVDDTIEFREISARINVQ